MSITAWSTTASQNGDRLNSGNFLEGQSPSTLNDGSRDALASIRAWANDLEWYEFGTGSNTTTYTRISATSISIPLDVTGQFQINRRVKIIDGTGSTRYGRVSICTYSSPNTTITFDFDSSQLGSGNPTSVKYGIISPNNTSLPAVNPVGSIVMFSGATPPSGWLLCDGASVSKTSYASLFAIVGSSFGSATSTNFILPNLQSKFPKGKDSGDNLGDTGGTTSQTPTGTNSAPTFTGNAFTPTGSVSVTGSVANHTLTASQIPDHAHNLYVTDYQRGDDCAWNNQATDGRIGGNNINRNNEVSTQNGGKGARIIGGTAQELTTTGGQGHNHSFSGSASFTGASATPSGSISAPSFTGNSASTISPYIAMNYIIKT
jgi:microcystin-dependent protein